MLNHNTKVAIEKLNVLRPLSSKKDSRFTIGDFKIGIEYAQPETLSFDLFYVVGIYNSDDEEGGTVEYSAQAITALDNKRQKPIVEDLLTISKASLQLLNEAFHNEAAKMRIGFTENIFPFTESFTENHLRAQIKRKLDKHFPNDK